MLRNSGEGVQARAAKRTWVRQAVAATAAVSIALGGMTTANAKNVNQFVDVPETNGFYDYVHELANEGIIGGYDNGMYFKPNNPLKRGQMAKMFVSVIEANDVKSFQRENKVFEDTKGTSYEGFASKAYRYDIVDGYGSDFRPNNNATRGQIAKLIVETFGFEKQGTYNPYKDTLNTAHADYVQILFEQGITNSPNNFRPNEIITRGQFAKMLAIALEKWEETKAPTVQVPTNEGEKELGEEVQETPTIEAPQQQGVQQASATISVRSENGKLNSMLSLVPKHTQTMSQKELDAIQNIRLYGDTAHFPSLPIGKYEVRVTALNGSYLGEVVQGATFEVKQGVENAHEVVVNTSGDKIETPTSPTTPTEETNVDKQEVVNVVPTNPSKPSTNGDVVANDMVTLKWRITDENGRGLHQMGVMVKPSRYDGLDVQKIMDLNLTQLSHPEMSRHRLK